VKLPGIGVATQVSIAVLDSTQRFPVRRVFCVGRNYAAHAAEMGASGREAPFFFTKFPCAVVPSGTSIRYPAATSDLQYEGELVLALGAAGHDVPADSAHELIFGYAAGLDMTRRDLQLAAREKGRPWDSGKNFEQSAPVGTIAPVSSCGRLSRAPLALTVNGGVRQKADIADMIWSEAEIIAHLSRLYHLDAGDIIFTGTPAGVGPVVAGDRIDVRVGELPPLTITIAA
jgi:fumarylpyruvate hydrolase